MAPIASVSRKRSLADMQVTDDTLPVEFKDEDFMREVLQLGNGKTEADLEDGIAELAQKFGITMARPQAVNENAHNSMCASTVESRHVRSSSTGSQGSDSTGFTSRASFEQFNNNSTTSTNTARKSLSFCEYERYLQAQEHTPKSGFVSPPIPAEPAPSLFSVSTKKSYVSIKNGFKRLGKLRRTKASQEVYK